MLPIPSQPRAQYLRGGRHPSIMHCTSPAGNVLWPQSALILYCMHKMGPPSHKPARNMYIPVSVRYIAAVTTWMLHRCMPMANSPTAYRRRPIQEDGPLRMRFFHQSLPDDSSSIAFLSQSLRRYHRGTGCAICRSSASMRPRYATVGANGSGR
ncbi:hypothetical protein PYCCODRAFT_220737 [Trametes coccinea BRFM310]|uniref:Uncharacterized protein n=1 Tax=Trametes coccinea (strain BRFM310) TaxID=1353009 RepID=A0A1Y2IQP7_TRAC3|nr:hypothetical protein PYCCODRAFT_220737 [Trametes coccinea BRFM310]